MRTTLTLAGILVLVLGLITPTGAGSDSTDAPKTEKSKGVSVDDVGRGLKSAELNIEKEIPKIGPAIGETFKKLTGKETGKEPSPSPEKQTK